MNRDHRETGPARPLRSAMDVTPEIKVLRRYLAYAILNAEALHRHKLATYELLATDPLIGSDHPVYVQIVRNGPTTWNPEPYLIEQALGRRFFPGETKEQALMSLRRKMTEGDG